MGSAVPLPRKFYELLPLNGAIIHVQLVHFRTILGSHMEGLNPEAGRGAKSRGIRGDSQPLLVLPLPPSSL